MAVSYGTDDNTRGTMLSKCSSNASSDRRRRKVGDTLGNTAPQHSSVTRIVHNETVFVKLVRLHRAVCIFEVLFK